MSHQDSIEGSENPHHPHMGDADVNPLSETPLAPENKDLFDTGNEPPDELIQVFLDSNAESRVDRIVRGIINMEVVRSLAIDETYQCPTVVPVDVIRNHKLYMQTVARHLGSDIPNMSFGIYMQNCPREGVHEPLNSLVTIRRIS